MKRLAIIIGLLTAFAFGLLAGGIIGFAYRDQLCRHEYINKIGPQIDRLIMEKNELSFRLKDCITRERDRAKAGSTQP